MALIVSTNPHFNSSECNFLAYGGDQILSAEHIFAVTLYYQSKNNLKNLA